MAELFQVSIPTINEHLKGIFEEKEVPEGATIRKFRIVQIEGERQVARDVDHYCLEGPNRLQSKSLKPFRLQYRFLTGCPEKICRSQRQSLIKQPPHGHFSRIPSDPEGRAQHSVSPEPHNRPPDLDNPSSAPSHRGIGPQSPAHGAPSGAFHAGRVGRSSRPDPR